MPYESHNHTTANQSDTKAVTNKINWNAKRTNIITRVTCHCNSQHVILFPGSFSSVLELNHFTINLETTNRKDRRQWGKQQRTEGSTATTQSVILKKQAETLNSTYNWSSSENYFSAWKHVNWLHSTWCISAGVEPIPRLLLQSNPAVTGCHRTCRWPTTFTGTYMRIDDVKWEKKNPIPLPLSYVRGHHTILWLWWERPCTAARQNWFHAAAFWRRSLRWVKDGWRAEVACNTVRVRCKLERVYWSGCRGTGENEGAEKHSGQFRKYEKLLFYFVNNENGLKASCN